MLATSFYSALAYKVGGRSSPSPPRLPINSVLIVAELTMGCRQVRNLEPVMMPKICVVDDENNADDAEDDDDKDKDDNDKENNEEADDEDDD